MPSIPIGAPQWPSAVVPHQNLLSLTNHEVRFGGLYEQYTSSAKSRLVDDSVIFPAVVREYDRRVGRAFLALLPEDLPAEARPLLHFGQRRGEKWDLFVREVANLVEFAVCDRQPWIISYEALISLARDTARDGRLGYIGFVVAHRHEVAPIEALLREVVPMTRARRGRDYARHLRDERERGKMAGVPGPVAEAVLGMVEEGLFTEERVRELACKEARMKTRDGGGR